MNTRISTVLDKDWHPYQDETGATINPNVCYFWIRIKSSAPKPREPSEEEKALWREQTLASQDLRKLGWEQFRFGKGIAKEQLKISQEQLEIGREQWNKYKDYWDNYAYPRMKHSYNYIKGLGGRLDADIGRVNRYFDDLQQRVEDYGSEGRIRAESSLAAGQVGRAFDRESKGVANMLNRFNLGTGRFTGALRSLALGKASAQAGARNQTRMGILDRDLAQRSAFAGQLASWTGAKNSLQQNYASLLQGGQMVPATGLQNISAGIGAANSAIGAIGAGTGTMGQGIAGLASVSGQMGAQRRHADQIAQANYQARQNMLGGLWGGLGSLAGSLGGAWILSGSDIRMKTNIKQIGMLPNDLKLYEYAYNDAPDDMYTGVMAQELLEVKPHLVFEDEHKLLWVDYMGLLSELANDAEKLEDLRPNIMLPAREQAGLDLVRT